MNTLTLQLTPEEASHLTEMIWLLKGSQQDNVWPESVNTLEIKIDTMINKANNKRKDWPTDY
tara:strand:- start:309 stop:494 length:186 start_codon:yes stop_codon:yes gene_type:complete